MNTSKQSIYTFDRQQLAAARIQLHYAIQPLAATSFALGEVQADSSHMALQWHDRLGFVTQLIPFSQSFLVALDPHTLTLGILSDRHKTISSFCLSERTLSEAFDWIKSVIKGLGGSAELITPISYPPDDFPDSDLAHGGTFNHQEMTQDLSAYYAIGSQILQNITEQEPTATPVRIWPHHFDIATLIPLPGEINGEALSVGVGLSPGDRSYDQPYWYVTPYPYPNHKSNLPALDGNGVWHTEYWVGAVLTASQFGKPDVSIAEVKTFLDSAIAACKKLLNF